LIDITALQRYLTDSRNIVYPHLLDRKSCLLHLIGEFLELIDAALKKEPIEEETADIVILCCFLAESSGFDLAKALKTKLILNYERGKTRINPEEAKLW